MIGLKQLVLLKHGAPPRNVLEAALRAKWGGGGGASYEKTVGPAPIISISDAKAKPAKSLIVGMEPIQAGSGDPSPDNIRPITGRTGMTVTRTGKNLFEPTAWSDYMVHGVSFNGSDCTPLVSFLNTLPAGDYTISFTFDVETTVSGATSWGILLHRTSGYIDGRTSGQHNAGETLTFTRTVNITSANKGTFDHAYMYSGGGNKADVYMYAFQLQVGSTVTAYEPYVGATFPVTWQTEAGTVYGGTVDVVSGVLTDTNALIDASVWTKAQEAMPTYTGDGYYGFIFTLPKFAKGASVADSKCSILKRGYDVGQAGYDITYILSGEARQLRLVVQSDTPLDVDTIVPWLESNGFQLCYELATPQTYQLTPTQIQLLKGSNTLWSDADNLTLTYIGTEPEEEKEVIPDGE